MPELSRAAVLVTNPNAGRSSRLLGVARDALTRQGVEIVDDIDVRELGRVLDWVARPAGERPLIVAAGGDGTVGAVVGCVADTGAVLGILPLGTSNDVARSLGIPPRLPHPPRLLVTGRVPAAAVARFAPAPRPGR